MMFAMALKREQLMDKWTDELVPAKTTTVDE
jgi:hypothetical protein